MKATCYEALGRRGQDWARLVASLRRIEKAVGCIPFEPFFEPVSLLVSDGPSGIPKLTRVTSADLNAWTKHVAYGTIARLRSLTGPYLDLLAEHQPISAGLLQRSMLEHAARAADSLASLTDGYNRKSWENMRESIPRSLFGTCLTHLEDTIFEELAEPLAQRPTKPSKLIESLESFAGTVDGTGKSFFGGLYAVLCDLAHASQRANSSFCEMLEDTGNGWVLKYKNDEDERDETSLGALRGTLRCLQAGYGACVLLLQWSFTDEIPDLVASVPDEAAVEWIWSEILDPDLVFWR